MIDNVDLRNPFVYNNSKDDRKFNRIYIKEFKPTKDGKIYNDDLIAIKKRYSFNDYQYFIHNNIILILDEFIDAKFNDINNTAVNSIENNSL